MHTFGASGADELNTAQRSLAEPRRTLSAKPPRHSNGQSPDLKDLSTSPSSSSAAPAPLPAATSTDITQKQKQKQKQLEDEEVDAYWAWLAAAAEQAPMHGTRGAGTIQAPVVFAQTQPSSSPPLSPQQPSRRRISYYAGFLPETLDREERAAAVWACNADAVGSRQNRLLSANERPTESVGWGPAAGGGGTSSSAVGGGTSLPSHRRRSTLRASFASTGNGVSASTARTPCVAFDETLAAAMISTANRIKAHQEQQEDCHRGQDQQSQPQPQRRRSSGTSAGVNRRVSTHSESVDAALPNASDDVHVKFGLNPHRINRSGSDGPNPKKNPNITEVFRGDGNSTEPPICRGSPPTFVLSPPGTSMPSGNNSRRSTTEPVAAAAVVATHDVGLSRSAPSNTLNNTMHRSNIGDDHRGLSDAAQRTLWRRQSTPILTTSSSNNSAEHARIATWSNGMLPFLPESSLMTLSQLTPPLCVNRSSRPASRVGSAQNARGTQQKDSSSDTNVQLSHHQLSEAFYGSYKGGKMARDAYLYFMSQQQQQQQHQVKDKPKKKSSSLAVGSSCRPSSPGGGSYPSFLDSGGNTTKQKINNQNYTSSSNSGASAVAAAVSTVKSPTENVMDPTTPSLRVAQPRHTPSSPPLSWREIPRESCTHAQSTSHTTPHLGDSGRRSPLSSSGTGVSAAGCDPLQASQPRPSSSPPSHTRPPLPVKCRADPGVVSSSVPTHTPGIRGKCSSPVEHANEENERRGAASAAAAVVPSSAAAAPDEDPKWRLAALWRQSERIYHQSQQQQRPQQQQQRPAK